MNEYPDHSITSLINDDVKSSQIYKLYNKAKYSLPYRSRMENLTWRMMYINSQKMKLKPVLDPTADDFDYIAHIKQMGQEHSNYNKIQPSFNDFGPVFDNKFDEDMNEMNEMNEINDMPYSQNHKHDQDLDRYMDSFYAKLHQTPDQIQFPQKVSPEYNNFNNMIPSNSMDFEDFEVNSNMDMELHSHQGSVVNLTDLNSRPPLFNHTPSLSNIHQKLSNPIPMKSQGFKDLSGGFQSHSNNQSPASNSGHISMSLPNSTSLPNFNNSPLNFDDLSHFDNFKDQKFDLKPKTKRPKAKKLKSISPDDLTMSNNGSKLSAADLQNQNITCTNCHTKTTPLWRRNPEGHPLCNACGLFLKLHGVVRPLSLKTDVIKKRQRNSNSTKKITVKDGDDLNPTSVTSSFPPEPKDKKSPRKRRPVSIPATTPTSSQTIARSNNSSVGSNSFGLGINMHTPTTNNSTPASINMKREDDLHPINEVGGDDYLNLEYVPDENLDWLSMAL